MKGDLKKTVKKNRKFLINLPNKPESPSPQYQRLDFQEGFDFSLPGSVPESPHVETPKSPRTPSTSTPTLESTVKRSAPVSFETIKSYVMDLFNKLTRQKELEINSKTPKNMSEEVKAFSRKLTDKMYDHLMTSRTYQVPVMPMGRSLSDSVISRTPHQAHDSKPPFAPEVLYVLVEDSVGKFLQKILLWVENDELDETVQSDKVSGAVEEIQNFIVTALTPSEGSDGTEESHKRSTTPSHSSSASAPTDEPVSRVSTEEQISPTSGPKSTSPAKSSESVLASHPGATESHVSRPSTSEKSEEKLSEVSVSSSDAEKMSGDLVAFLFIRVILKCSKKTKMSLISSEEMDSVITRLAELVQPELSSTESVSILEERMNKFTKKMSKGLLKEFGSKS